MKTNELVERLRRLRPQLSEEGVAHLAIFGSRARGDNATGSDIDILVDVDPSTRFSLLNLIGVEHVIEDETGISANALMRRSLDDSFRAAITKDVVEVF